MSRLRPSVYWSPTRGLYEQETLGPGKGGFWRQGGYHDREFTSRELPADAVELVPADQLERLHARAAHPGQQRPAVPHDRVMQLRRALGKLRTEAHAGGARTVEQTLTGVLDMVDDVLADRDIAGIEILLGRQP